MSTDCPGCHAVTYSDGHSPCPCPGITCPACQAKERVIETLTQDRDYCLNNHCDTKALLDARAEIARLTERNVSQCEQLRLLKELQDGEIAEHVRLAEEAKDKEIARLVADLRYVQGIVERGEQRTLGGDESITKAILTYVKKLESLVAVGREMANALLDEVDGELALAQAIAVAEKWRRLEGKG